MGKAGAEGDEGAQEALINLRVAGAWSGVLQVFQRWSVAELREEASRRSGFDVESINLICAGRNLKDSDKVCDLGLHTKSRVLMTRIGQKQAAPVIQEAERVQRLSRIRAAAEAMSKRGDGDFASLDEYDLSLLNQDGVPVRFNNESDRRAIVMGLLLHTKGRKLIEERQYNEALEVLRFAEESFLLCSEQSLLQNVDNPSFLQIDIVWCLFMLRDIGGLGIAKERLSKARNGLKRAHGENLERLRILQGGFSPELAIYVRLELLEGVVAFHSGLMEAAERSLRSAQEKLIQLQVPDESLAILASLGYTAKEAKRALRLSGQNVDRAVNFLMEQRELRRKKLAEDLQHRKDRREQQRYGKTTSGKAVDLKQLNALAQMGYDKSIVAEALKQADNNVDAALDILSNPTLCEALQCSLQSRMKRSKRTVDEAQLQELMQMGFSRERATMALQTSLDLNQALETLISQESGASSSNPTVSPAIDNKQSSTETSASEEDQSGRDFEMEDEIAKNITGDPYTEYDIEVNLEGDAIVEYLGLIQSSTSSTSSTNSR